MDRRLNPRQTDRRPPLRNAPMLFIAQLVSRIFDIYRGGPHGRPTQTARVLIAGIEDCATCQHGSARQRARPAGSRRAGGGPRSKLTQRLIDNDPRCTGAARDRRPMPSVAGWGGDMTHYIRPSIRPPSLFSDRSSRMMRDHRRGCRASRTACRGRIRDAAADLIDANRIRTPGSGRHGRSAAPGFPMRGQCLLDAIESKRHRFDRRARPHGHELIAEWGGVVVR